MRCLHFRCREVKCFLLKQLGAQVALASIAVEPVFSGSSTGNAVSDKELSFHRLFSASIIHPANTKQYPSP
jgi:hypothetical protein